MIEATYEGIPRIKIPWSPKIDYDKCITCGKCVDYCPNNVFGFQEENGKKITVVQNPDACVVFCRGCEEICPAGAITHPSGKETQKAINKLKREKSEDRSDRQHRENRKARFVV